ncbi:SDR family NAD(P)-dependent oxidoreductase [Microbacterium amylolyticum]|uniref:NAD(P)-dependent dehydrogenase (Short-subunit alcohol dehydrogenase family) n=1 Tax=Microbacterium amylolyticum TaxID=936337 RepID=A0ABS4ZI63_9MICO|nr:SDR family NAD(P)-dependent oxidoreductase [Microbacterium amylolyticum]MBP2436743.1 NAD(P)-dependent dehydrogenase (short-subunit alcohol dehydrogenase family) [Microbacterium amylolyticum]
MSISAQNAWDPQQLPPQDGKSFLVTGANAGVGYFTCEQLARAGAHVIMSGRSPHKLQAAHEALEARVPGASVETLLMDVANPGSIRAAAASVRGGLFQRSRLDGVVFNAGVVHTPKTRQITRDGRELVFATNALGHFVLGAELIVPLAKASSPRWTPRMVWLGSVSTRMGRYAPDDVQLEKGYSAWKAYVQSKVAVQALGLEADARLRDAGVPVDSVIAHPGYSIGGRTPIVKGVNEPRLMKRLRDTLQTPFSQGKERGADSVIRALIDPEVRSGDYWGPRMLTRGGPTMQRPSSTSSDPEVRRKLWEACEELSGLTWPLDKAAKAAR